MTASKWVMLYCDVPGCRAHVETDSPSVPEGRRWAAQYDGWSTVDKLDFCPDHKPAP